MERNCPPTPRSARSAERKEAVLWVRRQGRSPTLPASRPLRGFRIGLISLIADGFSADSFRFLGKLTLIIVGIFAVLLILGYLLYAAIMGGYYIVNFTMDEKTVVLSQSAKQAKKAENIGFTAMLMGLLTHNRGAVSVGYGASSRMTSTVEFDRVQKVVADKNHCVIKIRSIGWDHVYADGEDFDFVVGWIRSHIPEGAEWVMKS